MRFGVVAFGVAALATTASLQAACAESAPPVRQLNTLADVGRAIRGCWVWPPIDRVTTGMELTFMLSFKRNGEIFGGRITHESHNVSDQERTVYYGALADAIRRCSPLPVSESLGNAIAGRPFTFHITENRKQKKA
jgi:hypothetical protein